MKGKKEECDEDGDNGKNEEGNEEDKKGEEEGWIKRKDGLK